MAISSVFHNLFSLPTSVPVSALYSVFYFNAAVLAICFIARFEMTVVVLCSIYLSVWLYKL